VLFNKDSKIPFLDALVDSLERDFGLREIIIEAFVDIFHDAQDGDLKSYFRIIISSIQDSRFIGIVYEILHKVLNRLSINIKPDKLPDYLFLNNFKPIPSKAKNTSMPTASIQKRKPKTKSKKNITIQPINSNSEIYGNAILFGFVFTSVIAITNYFTPLPFQQVKGIGNNGEIVVIRNGLPLIGEIPNTRKILNEMRGFESTIGPNYRDLIQVIDQNGKELDIEDRLQLVSFPDSNISKYELLILTIPKSMAGTTSDQSVAILGPSGYMLRTLSESGVNPYELHKSSFLTPEARNIINLLTGNGTAIVDQSMSKHIPNLQFTRKDTGFGPKKTYTINLNGYTSKIVAPPNTILFTTDAFVGLNTK
jgi:hypothetical protein